MSKFLDDLYKEKWTAGLHCAKSVKKYGKKQGSPIYGEFTRGGANQLIKHMTELNIIDKDKHFYDIGSGTGKLALHIAKDTGCFVTGIEMVEERHDLAMEKYNKYKDKESALDKVSFINDKFQNVNLTDADVVYIDNTISSDNVVVDLISGLNKGCVIILKSFFNIDNFNKTKKFKATGANTEYTIMDSLYTGDGVTSYFLQHNGYRAYFQSSAWNYCKQGYVYLYTV